MASGFYPDQKVDFIQVITRSLSAIPMVIAKLWLPILLAVALKGVSYLAEYFLSLRSYPPAIEWSVIITLVLLQVYLWSVVLVGVDNLLARFSAFSIRSCFYKLYTRLIPVTFAYAFFVIWVHYTPHLFISGFSWLLKLFGMQGDWLKIISFFLGALLVVSGIVSYIFTPALVLLRRMPVAAAFKESSELVAPNWSHVIGVFSFCVLSALLTRPHVLLVNNLFGHGVSLLIDMIISFFLYPFFWILLLQLLRFVSLKLGRDRAIINKTPPFKSKGE